LVGERIHRGRGWQSDHRGGFRLRHHHCRVIRRGVALPRYRRRRRPGPGRGAPVFQTFKPVPGSTGQPNLNKIILTSPVALNVGDRFLVAISITNVIGLAPNDVYPFPIDDTTDSTGSYWDRSAPNTFNLDNLSQAKPIDQALASGGFVPGDYGGHLYIRAIGTPVPTSGPTLNIKLSGRSAVISWSPTSAGQQLLSAPTPNGPWNAITGAPNPYTATLGTTNTFYRVSQ